MASSRLYVAALLIYLGAWFMPVIEHGVTIANGVLPGWQALLVSITPIWEADENTSFLREALQVFSGLTNLVFLAALVTLAKEPPRRSRLVARALFAAAVLNGYWIWFSIEESMTLYAGYYAWLVAFPLLGLSALAPRRP